MALSIDEPGAGAVEAEPAEDLEPIASPRVKRGDVYILGRHAIACGDARDAALITRLTSGRKASVIFTDPPYNVKIHGFVSGLGDTRHGEFAMASGEMTKDGFTAFLAEFIAALIPALRDGAILFVCMDWRHMGELLEAGERNGLKLKNLCVWTKSNAGMGSFYRSAHELVFVFKHGEAAHQNNFELGQHGRSRSNVWPYRGVNTFGRDRMELLGVHPDSQALADDRGRAEGRLTPWRSGVRSLPWLRLDAPRRRGDGPHLPWGGTRPGLRRGRDSSLGEAHSPRRGPRRHRSNLFVSL